MTWHCGAMAASEEPETVVEQCPHTLHPNGCGAGRRKLNCKWNAIESTTNPDDRGRNARIRRKGGRGRACPVHEQPDGAVAKRILAGRAAFCRHSERRYRINP